MLRSASTGLPLLKRESMSFRPSSAALVAVALVA